MSESEDKFISFREDVSSYSLPALFTFPFYYQPDPLAELAAKQLQGYLVSQTDWIHNFGLDPENKQHVIGKMFGVLVVQKERGEVGFISAFSGKLADSNDHEYFVPPVFDILTKDGFFRKGEIEINELTIQLDALEKNKDYALALKVWNEELIQSKNEIALDKKAMNDAKSVRRKRRNESISTLNQFDFDQLKEQLKDESLKKQYFFKQLVASWEARLEKSKAKVDFYLNGINRLKEERRQSSNDLQQRIFDHYQFLNAKGNYKSLRQIFTEELKITPQAGTGECAAPKLLHYAYTNNLKPIAMAEFWWGQSPKSEIRKHKEYYPACRSKCEPILGHMLEGLNVFPNPMLDAPAENLTIEIIYEDDFLLVVNKPPEILSVPGINVEDSVQFRIQQKYPDATLVHRLDQSTSGLIVIAKIKSIYQNIQSQFIKRKVNKRYVALLDGILPKKEGIIDLPLRVDLDNRPHQLVCYEYGKPAQTKYKVISEENGITKVHFYPITGRTHQLRVHASHPRGLNTAILGDDLYGKRKERLYLHAEFLEFMHPVTREMVSFEVAAGF